LDERLEQIRRWLAEKKPGAGVIADDIDLLATGIVDSVTFVEYVLVIEDVCGQEIEISDTLIDRVRTLRSVAENFLSAA